MTNDTQPSFVKEEQEASAAGTIGAQRKVGHAFDLRKTFECGQCFRWTAAEELSGSDVRGGRPSTGGARQSRKGGSLGADSAKQDTRYIGVVQRTILELRKETRGVRILQHGGLPLSKDELDTYFDFGTNYTKVKQEIVSHAETIGDQAAIRAAKYCTGLRILAQDPFETLVSFMISANNNIPKIKRSIEDLCMKLGDPIGEIGGKRYHAFPTPEQIARHPEVVRNVSAIGYRDRGIVEAAEKITSGKFDLNQCLAANASFDDALRKLVGLYGVGEKVANCVLLFGLGHRNAFPVDTWVKKVLAQYYGVYKGYADFIPKQFPVHAGTIQQYLFFYLREHR